MVYHKSVSKYFTDRSVHYLYYLAVFRAEPKINQFFLGFLHRTGSGEYCTLNTFLDFCAICIAFAFPFFFSFSSLIFSFENRSAVFPDWRS